MSKTINSEEFKKEVLGSKETVLVDFYADWCSPCRMLSPILDEVGKDHKIYKKNVDDEEEIAQEYGVMSIPCVVAFKDGKELKRSVGLVDKDTILELFK